MTVILCWGVAVLIATSCVAQATPITKPQTIKLDDLWEDTPITKDLPHAWSIYRRFRNPSKLHTQLRLYMVRPKDWQPSDRRPAIVFIHGGGWSNGNPDQWFPQCRYFALRGLVAASVQYRLRTKNVDVDDCLADCKSAIRYIRRHATELGIDPQRIAVVGESAGGHLAAAVGTIDAFNHPEDDLSYSALPDALVLLNPITDLSTKWGKSLGEKAIPLSPLHHISERTPPTLLVHGDSDRCVNIEHSRAFLKRMTELDRPSKLVVLEGADHAFAVFRYGPDRFVRQTMLEIDNFLVTRDWLTSR
jgi:acetyl esterase/lipase